MSFPPKIVINDDRKLEGFLLYIVRSQYNFALFFIDTGREKLYNHNFFHQMDKKYAAGKIP